MLRSIKQLCGIKLGASDGDIGHVKDFYFDDQNWAVRYVVADTGSWLPKQQVLLSPHAFGTLVLSGKALPVSLTRKQIAGSPAVEQHRPVSRQYEAEYHRYYGWPYYWEGDGLWGGTRSFPVLEVPAIFSPNSPPVAVTAKPDRAEAHLRSTQAVAGYHLQASDGIAGHVCDFLVNNQSWAIEQMVVKIGHRFTGKEVLIPAGSVNRISYEESTVFVKLTTADVEQSPAHDPVENTAIASTPPALLPL